MADNIGPTSTPDYMMGFGEKMEQNLGRRVAGREAAYLLPHLKPGMRLLDVGCGPGSISVGLARAVDPGEFHGVDMEESQVELAAAAASEAGLSNARFQVADALDIPFPDNHFDLVHTNLVLQHLPNRSTIEGYLAEFVRVLNTCGLLVFQLPSRLPLLVRLEPRRRLHGVLRRRRTLSRLSAHWPVSKAAARSISASTPRIACTSATTPPVFGASM